MFLKWSLKYPSDARAPRQSQVWKSAKPRFRHFLLLLILLQTTYSSTGWSSDHDSLTKTASLSHAQGKIHTGYEATTTVNSSSVPKLQLLFRHHFTKLTRDHGAHAVRGVTCVCTHAHSCVYIYATIQEICGTSAKIIHGDAGMGCTMQKIVEIP